MPKTHLAKTNAEILIELTDKLPAFAADFLLTRTAERALGTRVEYARNFYTFLKWLTLSHPHFKDAELLNIRQEDMGYIHPVDIDKFLTYYRQNHKPATVARMKSAVSNFYTYLVNTMEMPYKNPCAGAGKVSIPKRDYVIYLTEQEQYRLINCVIYGTGLPKNYLRFHERLKKRDCAIIFLFLDTGMRLSELAGLDMGDLNISECSLIIKRKRNRQSQIFFSDSAKSYLKAYLEEREILSPMLNSATDPLFTSLQGKRLSNRQIENTVEKYTHAALPDRNDISPHKLRSSFAMEFYSATKDILTLQEKMGHESLTTTNIYVKAASSKARDSRNWR